MTFGIAVVAVTVIAVLDMKQIRQEPRRCPPSTQTPHSPTSSPRLPDARPGGGPHAERMMSDLGGDPACRAHLFDYGEDTTDSAAHRKGR